MLLSIIVPHYNEGTEIIRSFFDILNAQKGVDFDDFEVYLIHDGNEAYQKVCETFPIYENLDLHETVLPHCGVSACRNYGIEQAKGDWIAFCDCDDSYSSIFSLMKIFHVLNDKNSNHFDIIWGSFYIQSGTQLNISDKYSNVFIHNKYYRRSFLIEKNIRFNEKIRMSEDSAFNTIVKLEMDKHRIGQINSNEPLYSWCRRPGSITMDMDKWVYNAEGHFDRNLYILDEYRTRKLADSDLMIARTLTDAYSMLNKIKAAGDQTAFRKRLAAFYRENKILFERVPDKKVLEALKASDRDACVNEQDILIRPAFKKWLEGLLKE